MKMKRYMTWLKVVLLVGGWCALTQTATAYYDPGAQRWLNRDPIGQAFENNLYRFAENAPSLYVDSDGRSILGDVRSVFETLLGKGGCALAMGIVSKYVDMPKGGERYAHCMASCRIEKNCGEGAAHAAGIMKELWDLAVCLATRDANHCGSAFQPSDAEDNRTGRKCPPEKTCKEQCDSLKNSERTPGGPFEDWPSRHPADVDLF